MLEGTTRRLRSSKRGVSNVIVVMLSLVLIVVIVANVVLWSYQMNQFDWERMREDITVADAASIRDELPYNPSEYSLGGATSWVSGDVSSLTSDDGINMIFRSYSSGTDTSDFVDHNTSDVDSSDDKGTHGNFMAEQYGPDSIYDVLVEENTTEASNSTLLDDGFEAADWDINWDDIPHNWWEDNSIVHSGSASAWAEDFWEGYFTCDNLDASGASAIYVDFWFRKTYTESTDFTLYYYDGSSYDLIDELDDNGADNTWLHYTEKVTDSQYFVSSFRIRLDATLYSGEELWVDDILIKKAMVGPYDWGITSSAFTSTATHSNYRYMGGTAPNTDGMKVTKLHTRYSGTGTVAIALYTGGTLTDPTGATKRTEAFNVPVSSGWNEIDVPDCDWEKNTVTWIGWCHEGGSVYYSSNSGDAGDFQLARGRWSQTNPSNADETSMMPTSPGSGSFNNYWYAVYAEYETANYELDLEVQWTNTDYDEANEELCIKTGTFSGSEDVQVRVRSGSSWVWIMNLTANQWNNVSVASFLTESRFTMQFLDGIEASDTTQDNWDIDVTLLHVWSIEQKMEVEFTGPSNTEDWTRLNWTIDSAWTIGSVDVTLQLYNHTLAGYPASGNGYLSYTSNATASIDETRSQTITIDPTHFRNATGYWKIKITGIKTTGTPFDFKGDWIEFRVVKVEGILLTLENPGPLTSHLVSLWIINSRVHQKYEISVFISPGARDTLSYFPSDPDLLDEQHTVKVVTERGNIAIYSNA